MFKPTPAHPFMDATPSELETMKLRAAKDSSFAARLYAFRDKKADFLTEEFLTQEYADSVYSQHGRYYEVGAQMDRLLGVFLPAFLLDRDLDCAKRAKELLLHVCAFDVWTGPSNKDRVTPWHSELSTTRIALGVARGYDALFDVLNDEEKEIITKALWEKGIRALLTDWIDPQTRIHALDSMGHNWWAVCIALCGCALLPVSDRLPEKEVRAAFGAINKALDGFLVYGGNPLLNKVRNFDGDGLFYESVVYFHYGLSELLRYLYLYERRFGRNRVLRRRNKFFVQCADALLLQAYPTGEGVRFLDFGDSSYEANCTMLCRYLALLGCGTPAVYAYLSTMAPASDFFGLLHEEEWKRRGSFEGLPLSHLFGQSGILVSRDSWKNNATLYAIRCGFTWNHAHEDAGSFVLYDKGQPLLTDSGTCPYSLPEYRSYFTKSIAHNTLLMGGEGQTADTLYHGSKFPGRIEDYVRYGTQFEYTRADLAGPMAHHCNRAYRNFIKVSRDCFLILDEVRLYKPEPVSFLLHYNGEAWETEKGKLRIENGTSGITLTTHSERPVCTTLLQAPLPHLPEHKPLPYIKQDFTPAENDPCLRFWHVLKLGRECKTESIREKDVCGVRVELPSSTVEAVFNLRADGRMMHLNSNHTLLGFETDAYLLIRQKIGMRTYVHMINGSYLRRDGKVLYDAFSKGNATLKL
ncbi:MAG: heparinase II/III-family protein [Clostridia bacterium]|nr:heparinase II/III-family protein [Clostridia bacterium]